LVPAAQHAASDEEAWRQADASHEEASTGRDLGVPPRARGAREGDAQIPLLRRLLVRPSIQRYVLRP